MKNDVAGIRMLPTGVPGLDRVLGGGLPEYSFNLIAGAPGSGKTTLSQQIMFGNASEDRPALHFTVLGEPPMKMLRYQQQFDFFDPSMVERSIHYRNLSEAVLSADLDRVLDTIVAEVERIGPEIVVVDSFRTVVRTNASITGREGDLQRFLQRLSLHLTTWEVTSFLIGEYMESEVRDNPVFTIADGILWMHQAMERNTTIRKLQALKVRGAGPMPGLHTFRITQAGVNVFPRTDSAFDIVGSESPPRTHRLRIGIDALDEMMNGGIPNGDSVLLAGPSGSGKTAVCSHFLDAGLLQGETAVAAVYEESPDAFIERAESFGLALRSACEAGDLRIINLRPLDLSADEALLEIQAAVEAIGASRVVLDSLSGFELALAQTEQDEFRESLYRMVGALKRGGVTIAMTVENAEDFNSLRFSPHAISFLTDDIILQRYVELDGELEKVLAIVKMRGSAHATEWRRYRITDRGVVMGDALREYRGIVTGVPERGPAHNLGPESR